MLVVIAAGAAEEVMEEEVKIYFNMILLTLTSKQVTGADNLLMWQFISAPIVSLLQEVQL